MKIAIPTKSYKGLEDFVSDVFGKAKTFTILDIHNGSITNVEVVKNPAANYKHGAGPIVVKTLTEMNITAVATRELGIGASTLLEMNKIKKIEVKSNIPVKEAIQIILEQLNKNHSSEQTLST